MSELTPKEPIVNLELALDHSLTHKEYEMIVDRLGRIPSFTELGVSVWSEHCSYKNSIIEFKKLPEKANIYWSKPVKNAGLVDIGDGLGCGLKLKVISSFKP